MNRGRSAGQFVNRLALLLLFLSGCTTGTIRHDPVLTARLDAVLHRLDSSGATFTARVLELPNRRELYAVDIDAPYTPASNMKLPISATGLDLFGPQCAFKTYLAIDGEDLWVVGTGDPGLGDARIAARYGAETTTVFDDWADALKSRGITSIAGQLIYYDGALAADEQIHPTWDPEDLEFWYAAPVSGLNFNANCVDLTVYPACAAQPAAYEITPATKVADVVNQCVSGGEEKPAITRATRANTYTITGGCGRFTRLPSKPVTDPGEMTADALRTHLAERGIVIAGPTVRAAPATQPEARRGALGVLPSTAVIVATHETALTDVLWRINKPSQNLFAECLCKLSGQEFAARRGQWRPGTWADGEQAIRDFLRRKHIDDRGLVVADGSGLSQDDRVTSRLITDLLATMFVHPYGADFRASLAEPGEYGTLRGRLRDLSGRVYGKTGYINGVRSLSGYLQTRSGRWLGFSIIYNNIPGKVAPYEVLQDEACRILADWPDLKPTSPLRPTTAPAAVASRD